MADLTKQEIAAIAEAIAPLLVNNVRAMHHEFWIDPEKHFKAHMTLDTLAEVFDADMVAALKGLAISYKKGRTIFWSIFSMLVVLGSLYVAFQGWIHDKLK